MDAVRIRERDKAVAVGSMGLSHEQTTISSLDQPLLPPLFAMVLDGVRHDSARTVSTRVGGVHGSLQRVGAPTAVISR